MKHDSDWAIVGVGVFAMIVVYFMVEMPFWLAVTLPILLLFAVLFVLWRYEATKHKLTHLDHEHLEKRRLHVMQQHNPFSQEQEVKE